MHEPYGLREPLCHAENRIHKFDCHQRRGADAAYRQHAGGGPSHGHRQHAQKFGKDRACGSGNILPDRQTDILITILRRRSASEVSV